MFETCLDQFPTFSTQFKFKDRIVRVSIVVASTILVPDNPLNLAGSWVSSVLIQSGGP